MRRPSLLAAGALGVIGLVVGGLHGAPASYPIGVTIHDPAQAYQGLNLWFDPGRNAPYGEVVLMDMAGAITHSWQSPIVGYERILFAEPLDNGNVLVSVNASDNQHSLLVELDWSSTAVWRFDLGPGEIVHHDFERLDSGNTLVLTGRSGDYPEIGPNPVRDDLLVEVDGGGDVVWEWSTAEHWDELPFSDEERQLITLANAYGKYVLFHTNAVSALPPNPFSQQDPRFAPGNLLVSQRDTNLVMLIDRPTGDIVWYTRIAIGQHHPHLIPPGLPGAGNLLMLDNGGEAGYPTVSRLWSQVLEMDPPSQALLWQYDATDSQLRSEEVFLSTRKGGAQRLPNGNTLITEGAPWGRAFEVTSTGEIVWEFVRSVGTLYRMHRLDPSWPLGERPHPHDRRAGG